MFHQKVYNLQSKIDSTRGVVGVDKKKAEIIDRRKFDKIIFYTAEFSDHSDLNNFAK